MAKQKLLKFGIKNLKFAVKDELGVWGTPVDLAFAEGISLAPIYSEKKEYGDGTIMEVLIADKGLTGTLTVRNIEEAYEIACGRMIASTSGVLTVQQIESVEHAIYFEIEGVKDGAHITIKNWIANCITGRPSEAYVQSKDEATINAFEYPLTVIGSPLLNAAGTAEHIDTDGNTRLAWRKTAYPDSTGYATFGATVPLFKVDA